MKSSWFRHAVVILSTGLYVGFCPVAPGTAGTLLAVPLFLVLSRLSPLSYGITVLAFLFAAAWISGAGEVVFGEKDSGRIVIDEIGGFLVTMGFIPPLPFYVASGFLLFRLLDVTKPFPIRRLEKLEYGCGVVADDVMAGIYSAGVLHGLFLFWGNRPPLLP
ncbi:MAG: phosphatidylglycerophosphatase A [Deltaproteobacteria bacterium]|nr:phosphatidylglycerophosphatase A [Deltaproteobacteria bacterium]